MESDIGIINYSQYEKTNWRFQKWEEWVVENYCLSV